MKRNFLLLAALAASTFALVAYERPTLKEVMQQRSRGETVRPALQTRSDHNGKQPVKMLAGRKVATPAKATEGARHRLTSSGAELLGWLSYSDNNVCELGLYDIGPEGYTLKWADKYYSETAETLQTSWIRDNKLCGFGYQIIWGTLWHNVYLEYDLATGDLVDRIDVERDQGEGYVVMQNGAYNESEDCVYGYGQCGSQYVFMNVFPDAPEIFNVIRPVPVSEVCGSICYNKYDDSLYGINKNGDFVSIDSEGRQNALFKIPLEGFGSYITGLAYYPAENVYYWNVIQSDGTASMALVNPKDESLEIYENFATGETFSSLFCLDDKLDPRRPKRPSVTRVDFADGATNGVVIYSIPAESVTGNAINGMMSYTSYLNGEECSKGEVEPGVSLEVRYENLSDGMYSFGLTVASEGVASSMVSTDAYIGNDIPLAPTDVVLTATEVSWQAVTEGVHNAYLDLDAMTYEVFINGEPVGETKSTSMAVTLPSDKPLSLYAASVKAICNGKESEMSGESNTIGAGAPMDLPVYIEPTYEEYLLMTQYDPNGVGWSYLEISEGNIVSSGMSEEVQDNWLFLPPFKVDDTERLYTFSFDAFTWGEWYTDEYVEVMLCKSPSPDGCLSTVISKFSPNEVPTNHFGFIQAPEPGTYYIALHCTSWAWQLGVLAMNFRITDDNILLTSPGAPEEVSAVGAEDGVLEALVSFVMPDKMINGDTLSADMELVAKVKSEVAEAEVKGKPGERVEVVVATVQGNNKLSISVSDGISNGRSVTVDVFTGVDIPAEVTNLRRIESDDMMSVKLEWESPTIGVGGGYINPEEVTYDIYRYELNYVGWYWQVYKENVKDTYFTYMADAEAPQELVQLGVKTRNAAGSSDNMVTVATLLGTPYALPLNENFDDPYSGMSFEPWISYAPDASYDSQQWNYEYLQNVDGSYSGETIGLLGTTWYDDTKGMLGFPRFTTKGCEEVELSITVLNGPNMPKVALTGETYGLKSVEIGSVEKSETEGLQTYTFRLPAELIGKDWVQVYLNVEYETYSQFVYIEDVAIQGTTVGVSAVEAGTSIAGGVGSIRFKGLEGVETSVVSADGKVVYSGRIDSNDETIQIQKGVYMVKSGSQSAKVYVK